LDTGRSSADEMLAVIGPPETLAAER
jgi:hypothetical protein